MNKRNITKKNKSVMEKWNKWDKQVIKKLKTKSSLTIFEAATLAVLEGRHSSSSDNSSWATPYNW